MSARYCEDCHVKWPSAIHEYRRCPTCGRETVFQGSAEPLSHDEATHKIAEHRFEQWVEKESPAERVARQQRERVEHERLTARAASELPFRTPVTTSDGLRGRVVDAFTTLADEPFRLVRLEPDEPPVFEWYRFAELNPITR